MTPEDFETLVQNRIEECEAILFYEKDKEYTQNDDRLHNFKTAGKIQGITTEKAVVGMMMKHFVSILDMVDNPDTVTKPMVDSKFSDAINYMYFIEAALTEYKPKKNNDKTGKVPIVGSIEQATNDVEIDKEMTIGEAIKILERIKSVI